MIRLTLAASTALVAAAAMADPMPEAHVSPDGHAFTLIPVAEAD